MPLLSVFFNAVLPVFLLAGAGYAVARGRSISVDSLTTVTVYVLIPALVFDSLVTTPLGGVAVLKSFVGVALYTAGMYVVAGVVGWGGGVGQERTAALVLGGTFSNVGSFGIPIAGFAFGPLGRSTAVMFLVAQNVMMYTLGAYVAARGADRTADLRSSVRDVFRLPLLYAFLAAVLLRVTPVAPPESAMRAVAIAGDGAIPMMLLILGVQFSKIDVGTSLSDVGTAFVLKLGVAPVVGLVVALAVAFPQPTVARVFVFSAATPTALVPLMLSIEYADDASPTPNVVTGTVVSTTLASLFVLTGLVALLQSGAVV